jgi:hypothetical protein
VWAREVHVVDADSVLFAFAWWEICGGILSIL